MNAVERTESFVLIIGFTRSDDMTYIKARVVAVRWHMPGKFPNNVISFCESHHFCFGALRNQISDCVENGTNIYIRLDRFGMKTITIFLNRIRIYTIGDVTWQNLHYLCNSHIRIEKFIIFHACICKCYHTTPL